jgi:DNA-directed RNA polymerase specialized sigma24 family protein
LAGDRKPKIGHRESFDLRFEVSPRASQVEINDLSELLNRAIQILPEAQKEVIDLAFFNGMSQREISAKGRFL